MLKGLLGLHALFDRDLDPERQSDRGCYFAGHPIAASAIVLLLWLKKKKTDSEIIKKDQKTRCYLFRHKTKSVEVPSVN